MYAVIEDKGKQYKVSVGDELLVDLMKAEEGDAVEFDHVLMVGGSDNGSPSVGRPCVAGARVVARVLQHEKGPKVMTVRYKGPSEVKKGHRQKYTRLLVQEIHPG